MNHPLPNFLSMRASTSLTPFVFIDSIYIYIWYSQAHSLLHNRNLSASPRGAYAAKWNGFNCFLEWLAIERTSLGYIWLVTSFFFRLPVCLYRFLGRNARIPVEWKATVWRWRPSRSSRTAAEAAGAADGGDPWLVDWLIDRLKDCDDDDEGDYRPSSRRPDNVDSRRRRRQRMRPFQPDLVAVAPFELLGVDDDGVGGGPLMKESTIEGSFKSIKWSLFFCLFAGRWALVQSESILLSGGRPASIKIETI